MNSEEYEEHLNALGFYEVKPKPSTEQLTTHYSLKYYQEAQGTYSAQYQPNELKYFRNVAKVALETVRHLNVSPSLIDLGCGEGFFAKAFLDFGWQVSCCDFSDYGIQKHNSELLPFFKAGDLLLTLHDQIKMQKKFGMVNLQNVLEHVLDPVSLLVELKNIVDENGIVRIRVPNDYSDFQNLLVANGMTNKTWFSPPEHLSYFNKKGLQSVLDHCGYRIISLQANFPIEVFLANRHSNYWADRNRGKEAHFARIFCENQLIETSIPDFIEYSQAAAKLGFGRELVAYVTPAFQHE